MPDIWLIRPNPFAFNVKALQNPDMLWISTTVTILIKDNENEANDSSSDDEYVEVTTKRRRSVPEMWSFDPNEDIVQPEGNMISFMEF